MDTASASQPVRVLSVFGTRPEAIKMAPLVQCIQASPGLESRVCVTAQHREMLDQVLRVFSLRPDYDLDLMRTGQTLPQITSGVLGDFSKVLREAEPDLVLVHGDTTTCFSAALAAFYEQIPVGHVEAGLRTFDMYSPFPEEMNRSLVGRIATMHFAPTSKNRDQLLAERCANNIYITGNTVIDALLYLVRRDYTFREPSLNGLDYTGRRTVLLTAHRRENLGEPMRQIFTAVRRLADQHADVLFIYPVHKNPKVQAPAREILGGHPRILLIDPIEVDDMHNLISRCFFVMTDSGGLQEEAPALGKPVLVLRTETERPEAVEAGTVRVVGVRTDDIVDAANRLLGDPVFYDTMARAVNPYGDGRASSRICAAIQHYFGIASARPLEEFAPGT